MWRHNFRDWCIGVKALDHITCDPVPNDNNDMDWYVLDVKNKSWFYKTCVVELLTVINSDVYTAKNHWEKLDQFFFRKNKTYRMLQL